MVYLDERSFAQDIPRTHGYSRRKVRCYDFHDWYSKGRINAIRAIVGLVFLTVALFEGSLNRDVFYAGLIYDLIPMNAVIVMDNASFHQRADRVEVLERSGRQLEFLPPYSPDFNPMEKKWAQVKAIRKRERYDIDTLFSMRVHYDTL